MASGAADLAATQLSVAASLCVSVLYPHTLASAIQTRICAYQLVAVARAATAGRAGPSPLGERQPHIAMRLACVAH